MGRDPIMIIVLSGKSIFVLTKATTTEMINGGMLTCAPQESELGLVEQIAEPRPERCLVAERHALGRVGDAPAVVVLQHEQQLLLVHLGGQQGGRRMTLSSRDDCNW
jgi:hypothetical protein